MPNISVSECHEPMFEYPRTEEECNRCINDILRNANSSMISWAERNYKHKVIELLFDLGYYKDNQTIYLNKK